jgi:transitional endoplasmic reticulum ATPase
MVFQQPELGRQLGVEAPAGILLHGPPGTGKTTVAKALASQVRASFYEQSAADLLSKYVGESEERVARLFARARENRPSIIFLDEVDALLKRRSAASSAPWEERVVSQFLRELDGLVSMRGVLLVGATNRLDIIDEAVVERRLVSLEVPLPDGAARRRLLELVTRGVRLAADVDLGELAAAAEGMSGADLKAVRNAAGMKALARAASSGTIADAAVAREDFLAALQERGVLLIPD